jgi:hypothetical protein
MQAATRSSIKSSGSRNPNLTILVDDKIINEASVVSYLIVSRARRTTHLSFCDQGRAEIALMQCLKVMDEGMHEARQFGKYRWIEVITGRRQRRIFTDEEMVRIRPRVQAGSVRTRRRSSGWLGTFPSRQIAPVSSTMQMAVSFTARSNPA